MWAHPCAHVIFDTDPTPRGRGGPAEEEEMSQALIRSVDTNSPLLKELVDFHTAMLCIGSFITSHVKSPTGKNFHQ